MAAIDRDGGAYRIAYRLRGAPGGDFNTYADVMSHSESWLCLREGAEEYWLATAAIERLTVMERGS